MRVAAYVDQKMREINEKLPVASVAKVAVLTSLNLADELFKERDGKVPTTALDRLARARAASRRARRRRVTERLVAAPPLARLRKPLPCSWASVALEPMETSGSVHTGDATGARLRSGTRDHGAPTTDREVLTEPRSQVTRWRFPFGSQAAGPACARPRLFSSETRMDPEVRLLSGAPLARRCSRLHATRRRLRARGVVPTLALLSSATIPPRRSTSRARKAGDQRRLTVRAFRIAARGAPDEAFARLPALARRPERPRDPAPDAAARPAARPELQLAIPPAKDVDGFHPENLGRLALGLPGFVACTPLGILPLLQHYKVPSPAGA